MRNTGRSANHTITLQSKQRTAQNWKRWDLKYATLKHLIKNRSNLK
jgi:hypothetical protein